MDFSIITRLVDIVLGKIAGEKPPNMTIEVYSLRPGEVVISYQYQGWPSVFSFTVHPAFNL